MARNSEKAQSMLYRFREQQAVEMGMGNRTKGDRRPRMASSVSSLRDCERWRGDILRDISRKVSKIQDTTLTDYEIRDLNDDINQLMREKRHWETQIVNLGGANYKRAQGAMVGDDGKEVPGTRGYKYFGRARELPGVKELFTRGSQQASEESARNASFQMFRNQGPEYYGDIDEMDEKLADEEDALAREDWATAVSRTATILTVADVTVPYPSLPTPAESSTTAAAAVASSSRAANEAQIQDSEPRQAKRKAQPEQAANGHSDAAPEAIEVDGAEEEVAKRARIDAGDETDAEKAAASSAPDPRQAMARSFLGMLDPESLKAPSLPTTDEMGKILLEVRKRALREEYGV